MRPRRAMVDSGYRGETLRHLAKHRPSGPMVVALLALFVALGGTGYAALKLPKNSVGTKQLQRGAVTGPKIKDNSITGADITESKLGPVPVAGGAFNSAKLGGVAASDYVRRGDLQPESLRLVQPTDGSDCVDHADVFCSGAVQGLGNYVWHNYDHGYAAVGYRKDSGGWVHLEGVVDGGQAGRRIFTLPDGYRPPYHGESTDDLHEFPALQCGATNVTWVDIQPDGGVRGGSACLTLDGITFHP